MKSVIVLIIALMMAKPIDVEGLWRDAQTAYREYRFADAVTLCEQYMAEEKHNRRNDAACAKIKEKAETAAEMMENIEDITVLDSAKCSKSQFLDYYGLKNDAGRLRMENGCVSFTTGRGDRKIETEKSDGKYDLWIVYSDGEKRKMSDVVNSGANENYPFELADGATLYFASDGHGSIGGYDIFMTRYNNETFEYSEPMHVGMPFNSTSNDYMMVVDELANVGWFATDRFQKGDTVVVYKFKIEEKKRILPTELEDGVRIATAQLRRYRVGYDTEEQAKTKEQIDDNGIEFVVNDTLVYSSVNQFRDSSSVAMYGEMKDLENNLRVRSAVLEGKKLEFRSIEDAEEREALRREILEDEQFVENGRRRMKELKKAIRFNEIKAINKNPL